MTNRVAIAFCVHHKPWLMMSTWITTLVQDYQDVDFYIIYNVGDGSCSDKESYQEYHQFRDENASELISISPQMESESYGKYEALARRRGINAKLSPFDERMRSISKIRRSEVYEIEFENDHALDSGCWLKFIRAGHWRKYDHVFFMQEGTLLTRPNAISAALHMATEHNVHFLAAGHYKSRTPKDIILNYMTRHPNYNQIDVFHDRMIMKTFEVFCRDGEFRHLFEHWSSNFEGSQQAHIPGFWRNSFWRRIARAADPIEVLPTQPTKRMVAGLLRRNVDFIWYLETLMAQTGIVLADKFPFDWDERDGNDSDEWICVDTKKRLLSDLASIVDVDGVKFHRENGPEWHGCSCNHMLSREFLERLHDRMEHHNMYDVLDIPFAGTALEVIWGFLPSWLGFDKWFFDGQHRVAKNFANYRREDNPKGMARYINQYYGGELCVDHDGDYLKIRRARKRYVNLKEVLGEEYF